MCMLFNNDIGPILCLMYTALPLSISLILEYSNGNQPIINFS